MVCFPLAVFKACDEEYVNKFVQADEAWKICAASPGFKRASGRVAPALPLSR